MTTTTKTHAPTDQAEAEAPSLGELLVRSAKSSRDRAAAQAWAEEETLLAHQGVRSTLVVKERAGR